MLTPAPCEVVGAAAVHRAGGEGRPPAGSGTTHRPWNDHAQDGQLCAPARPQTLPCPTLCGQCRHDSRRATSSRLSCLGKRELPLKLFAQSGPISDIEFIT